METLTKGQQISIKRKQSITRKRLKESRTKTIKRKGKLFVNVQPPLHWKKGQ